MGILYQASDPMIWAIWLFVVFALMAFNEFGRTSVWGGVTLFIVAPIVFTIFVWPHTAAPGNEYGTGNWFNWAKTYSALAGCIGFMALRFVKWRGADGKEHHLHEKRWALCFPPLILAINIAEAVVRDVQMFTYGLWGGAIVDHVWMISGPWNIMNAIAGILNIVTICGWFGIFISRDKSRDMIWPDMLWMWIIAYDLWNFAYTYNSVSDRSMYCGLVLLAACTIPAFFIKRGAYAQHRVRTLAVNMIVTMTIPWFFLHPAFVVHSTNNPAAHMTISVIALIFNASVFIYQAYTIFGKKRNPFKQELYIDNPRFRRVYLESIDVPEGQREAALANLEEFGYVAAWDEKGRVKTMVERP